MSIENSMKCTNSYFIDCDSLLQNATGVFTKCDNYFITKCYRSLLHNTSGFLLQNVTVLLQNSTGITNFDNFITKCNSYYKMWHLLQIATVHMIMI